MVRRVCNHERLSCPPGALCSYENRLARTKLPKCVAADSVLRHLRAAPSSRLARTRGTDPRGRRAGNLARGLPRPLGKPPSSRWSGAPRGVLTDSETGSGRPLVRKLSGIRGVGGCRITPSSDRSQCELDRKASAPTAVPTARAATVGRPGPGKARAAATATRGGWSAWGEEP
jgi:hypothetical protein